MKKKFGVVTALMVVLLFSCTQYVFVPFPGHGNNSSEIRYTASEVARSIPVGEIARLGLMASNSDIGYRVEQSIEPSSLATSSISVLSDGGKSLVSRIWFTGYVYDEAVFTTSANNPVVVTYPIIEESGKEKIETYEISAESLSIEMPNASSASTVSISISGEITYSTKPTVTESGNTITVSNIPSSRYFESTIGEGGYVVNGENVSVADGAGMTGTEEEPYRISKLSDVAVINSLIQSQQETNFILEVDLTLDESWIMNNMTNSETMQADPITISAGKDVTLDFNNHTITFNGIPSISYDPSNPVLVYPFRIEEGGILTINNGASNSIEAGDGGFTNTDKNSSGIFHNYGTLIINGGSFETNGESDHAIVNNYKSGNLTINNARIYCSFADAAVYSSGTATINNGYFYSNSNSRDSKLWFYTIVSDGFMTINGGEVYGIQGGISAGLGSFIVNDVYSEVSNKEVNGEMTNCSFYAIYIAGERGKASSVVNGGTFITDDKAALWVGNSNEGGDGGIMEDAAVVVNGGRFKSGKQSYDVQVSSSLADLSLNGGEFVHNVVYDMDTNTTNEIMNYISEGYQLIETGDTEYIYEVVPNA